MQGLKLAVFGLFWSAQIACASSESVTASCFENPEMQSKRSRELQEIVKADQSDRQDGSISPDVLSRDLLRRRRVGEIFGEGCLASAADYAAAALVFQHGNVPEHFFQTFLWAKRAVELGDVNQKWLMAAGIDRYLVNSGRKQLFATQFWARSAEECWCLNQVESTFPESTRVAYTGKTLAEALDALDQLNEGKQCPKVQCTESKLLPSPQGTVPGFW